MTLGHCNGTGRWVVSVPFCKFAAALSQLRSAPDVYEVVCGPGEELTASAPGQVPVVNPVRCSLEPDTAVLLALNHLIGPAGRKNRVTVYFRNGECEDVHGKSQRLAVRVEQDGGVEHFLPTLSGGLRELLATGG